MQQRSRADGHSSTPGVVVRLAAGRSPIPHWTFDGSIAPTEIVVGPGLAATWTVEAPGMASEHAALYWDGSFLWIADCSGAGVYVDGERIDDWFRIERGVLIALGDCILEVQIGSAAQDEEKTRAVHAEEAHPRMDEVLENEQTEWMPARTGGTHPAEADPRMPLVREATAFLDTNAPPPPDGDEPPPRAIAPLRPVSKEGELPRGLPETVMVPLPEVRTDERITLPPVVEDQVRATPDPAPDGPPQWGGTDGVISSTGNFLLPPEEARERGMLARMGLGKKREGDAPPPEPPPSPLDPGAAEGPPLPARSAPPAQTREPMPLRKKILLNVLLFVTLTSGAAIVYRQVSAGGPPQAPPGGGVNTASPPSTQPVDPDGPGEAVTAAQADAGAAEQAAREPDAGAGPGVTAAAAAAFVIAGRHDEALEAYEELLAHYPDDVAYRAAVDILSRKVQEAERMRGVRP
jgi:hypothetical protein